MKTNIPRLVLGAIFIFAGLNGFFSFLPNMGGVSDTGATIIESLKGAGFVWPLINTVELLAGTFLVFNVMGQLAVLLLAPICLGIFLFHTFYSVEGSLLAWVAIALELTLLVVWRKNFLHMFKEDNKNDEYFSEDSVFSGGHHSRDSRKEVVSTPDFTISDKKRSKRMSVERRQEQEMEADHPLHPDAREAKLKRESDPEKLHTQI